MKYIALTLTLLFPTLLSAQAGYEYLGPDGSWINSMAMTADGTIYAEAYPHLFRLRPGEAEWQRIHHYDTLDNGYGGRPDFSAFNNVLVTLSGCCSMYLSFDNGETWQPGPTINVGGARQGSHDFAEWKDTLLMRVPVSTGQLMISTDSARSWSRLQQLEDRRIMGVGSRGIYLYSNTAGLSRLDIHTGEEEAIMPVPDAFVRALASVGDTVIVEIARKGETSSNYYRSFDAGVTWDSLSLPTRYGLTIAGGRIWTFDDTGVYATPLNAMGSDLNWRLITTTGVKPYGSSPLIVDNDTLHLGSTLGYYRADPGQDQAVRKSEGMVGFRIENTLVTGDSLIIGTPSDFFITGVHPASAPPYSLKPRSLPTGTRSEYMVGDDAALFTTGTYVRGIHRSTDNGLTWDTLRDGITSRFTYAGVYLIGDRLIARPRYSGDTDLLWSDDRGQTWDSVKFPGRSVYSVAGSSDTLFVSTSAAIGSELPLLRTFDGGKNWDSTWGPQQYISYANLHYEDGGLYYDIRDVGIFRSDDFGNTWTRLQPRVEGSTDSLPAVVSDLEIAGDTLILAGTLDTRWKEPVLLFSTDRGSSWQKRPSPPTGSYTLRIIDDYLYIGSYSHGVFRTNLTGLLSTPVGGPLLTESSFLTQIGQSRLRVEASAPGTYQIRFYTLDGRSVLTVSTDQIARGGHFVIDLSTITPGHYLAVLTIGSETLGSTVVVVR